MRQQILFFFEDVRRMQGKHWIRIFYLWMSRAFCGIALYRFERGGFLLLGRPYSFIRIIFTPLINLVQAYSNIDIHYKANIKGGMLILHPAAGIVVSGSSIIGKNLTLTGGNIIGLKGRVITHGIAIGDYCSLGANAVVMGPIRIGNRIQIGASACVVKDCELDNVSLTGVPAKVNHHRIA